MDPLAILLVAGVGLLGGVASGLFGIGGGILMVPLLLLVVPGTGFKEAKAASLVVVTASSLVAVLAHRRRGSADLRTGLLLGAPGVAGAILAARFAEGVSDRALTVAFGGVLVVVGAHLLVSRVPRGHSLSRGARATVLVSTGFVAGALAGLFGIGGGAVVVPALAFLGVGMHLAVGTSLVAVGINAAATTATHVALGYLPTLLALGVPLALGAVPGGEAGARLAHRLPAARLQRAFGAFLVLAGAWLALAP